VTSLPAANHIQNRHLSHDVTNNQNHTSHIISNPHETVTTQDKSLDAPALPYANGIKPQIVEQHITNNQNSVPSVPGTTQETSLDAPALSNANGIKPQITVHKLTNNQNPVPSLPGTLTAHEAITNNQDSTSISYNAHLSLPQCTVMTLKGNDNIYNHTLIPHTPKIKWEAHDYITANKRIRASGQCNARGCRILIPTEINYAYLSKFSEDYHDKEVLEFAKFGWPLSTDADPIQTYIPSNHSSARNNPKEIKKFLNKAEQLNSILGPFDESPFDPPLSFSPLGAVDKKDSDSKRIIHDLSWPKDGTSVNAQIQKNSFLGDSITLHYPGVDNLVDIIKRKGVGCAIFKRDIASAYRQILRVDPGCIHKLGFTWNHKVYHDLTKPQGCRSAALSCQRFTEFIIHIYQTLKAKPDGVVYQDDMADAEVWSSAFEAYDLMGTILQNAGIQEATQKRSPPDTQMIFLGVYIDTLAMTISVTSERMADTRTQLGLWQNKVTCTKLEMQSLIGTLTFVAKCVRPGRSFLARMIAFMKAIPEDTYRSLSKNFRKDLNWWSTFIHQYNGTSMILHDRWSAPDIVFTSDACMTGCGAWCGQTRTYFKAPFPNHVLNDTEHINQLELLTIVVALKFWANEWRGKRILIRCDNDASCLVINAGRSNGDNYMMKCAREIAYICATSDFEVKALHLEGKKNVISDYLSRAHQNGWSTQEFKKLVGPGPVVEIDVSDNDFVLDEAW